MRRVAFGAIMAAACACASSIAVAGPAAAAAPAPAAPALITLTPSEASPLQEPLPAPNVTLADLQALASKIGRAGTGVIVIDGKSDLDGYPTPSLSSAWSRVIRQVGAYSFTVVVEHAQPTGTAGSLLYALATERVVASGATLTKLPAEFTKGQPPACSRDLCASLASADITVSAGSSHSAPGSPAVVTAAAPTSGGESTWLLVALVVVAAVAAWLVGGRRVVQRMITRQPAAVGSPAVAPAMVPPGPARQPGGVPKPAHVPGPAQPPEPAPRPRPVTRTGPVTKAVQHGPGQGIVRTVMSPEGYVEIDGVLYRATWRGSRDAPLRGAVVAIRRDQYGDLVAVDSGPGRDGPG